MDSVLAVRDERHAFAQAARIGFGGVEVGLTRAQLRDPDGERLAALGRAKAASGLAIPSLVLGEHNDGGLASPDVGVVTAASEDVRLALRWAAVLGTDVVLVPFFLRNEIVTEADFDRCVAALRELCPLAEEIGVALCFEGLLPAGRIRLLAERVGSPAFGCYFDLANPVSRGLDSPTEIRALGGLIRRVHLKDTLARRGDCRPGLGRVDFPECARALLELGYDGWLVLETPHGPWELAARDLSFARTVFSLPRVPSWPRLGAFSRGFGRGEATRLGAAFRELGLESVQVEDELLDECLTDPTPVRTALAEHDVSIAAVAGYRNLVTPDAKARRENVAFIARCLELAPALGTSVVATETGTRSTEGDWTDHPDNWGEEAWDLLLDALEALLPVAERSGSILALEATVKNVLKTAGQALDLFQRFPTEHLQLVLDPYNYLSSHLLPVQGRATADLLDRFEHRFVLAHGKDVGPDGAEVSTPELGTGVFEQQPYLEFLRTRRPDLPLVLEHLPFEHLPAAIARVKAPDVSGA